jgi:hypothetical protein
MSTLLRIIDCINVFFKLLKICNIFILSGKKIKYTPKIFQKDKFPLKKKKKWWQKVFTKSTTIVME